MSSIHFEMIRSLSEESDSKNQIIAPIPTKSFLAISRLHFDYPFGDASFLKSLYMKELSLYCPSYQTEAMITRVVNSSGVNLEIQTYPLVKIFSEICYEMMMSDLELSGFSIYLNRFVWPVLNDCFLVILYTVAFALKYYFSANLDPILFYLTEKIPNFINFLNNWLRKNEDFLPIDISELSKEYSILTKKPFNDIQIKTNFYVDQILEKAPASVYEKKWWHKELLKADEIILPDPPSFIKLDSIFCEALPGFSRSFSLASNQSLNYLME